MERPLKLQPLSIQDENSAIHRKRDGKSKSSKPISKKAGTTVETRKPLNDITNKSSVHLEASSRKKRTQDKKSNVVETKQFPHHAFEAWVPLKEKNSTKEEINFAEEGFLHDHGKCIEGQKAALELNFWDIVLPGHDSADLPINTAESDPDISNSHCFDELEELPMSDFSEWYESHWNAPPSPIRCPSLPLSSFDWELEPVELLLKEEDCHYGI